MRVLFTTVPAAGHFQALVPLARALQQAGHDVAFATAATFVPTVEAAHFRSFAAGAEWRDVLATPASELSRLECQRPEAEDAQVDVLARMFIRGFGRRMVTDLLGVADRWPADLLLRGSFELSASVVAERLGIPHASVQTGGIAPGELTGEERGSLLKELRARAGLPPDAPQEALHRHLHICQMPPGYFTPGTMPEATLYVRPSTFDQTGQETLPDWAERLGERPVVYVTMGTVVNRSAQLFQRILDGLMDEPLDVVVTVGRDRAPSSVGSYPSNVHVERYIPNSLLLPLCSLAVMHGGYGSVMSALVAGVPLVLVPVFADQPANARACARLGIGQLVEPTELAPDSIRAAVRRGLNDGSYRTAARRVRDQLKQLPSMEQAIERLERLAATAQR